MNEVWKDIKGYERYYEVSNLGNIRRKKSGRIRRIDYAQDYPTILLSADGRHKTLHVHRLVADAFCIKSDGKYHVNHINGNKQDNNASNLEWVTQAYNNLHSYRSLGRSSYFKGKIPHNKRMKESDISIMSDMNLSGISTDEIGKSFGFCGSTVRKHLRKYRKNENI